ncbi:MAG: 30S ribosomal protein S6 [Verrucomicrobia bacterium]|nr:30S ribosomal protein S6 [Verrucomicrobiota bacterium]
MRVKRYEGLFILNTSGKEENVMELIEKVRAEITAQGGKIETVQKMDKQPFARVTDKRHPSGYYVNIIFSAPTSAVATLRTRFATNEDVFRALFFVAPKEKKPEAALPATA